MIVSSLTDIQLRALRRRGVHARASGSRWAIDGPASVAARVLGETDKNLAKEERRQQLRDEFSAQFAARFGANGQLVLVAAQAAVQLGVRPLVANKLIAEAQQYLQAWLSAEAAISNADDPAAITWSWPNG